MYVTGRSLYLLSCSNEFILPYVINIVTVAIKVCICALVSLSAILCDTAPSLLLLLLL